MAGPYGFGNPGEMGAFPGVRTTPPVGYQPTPNSEPTGSITGTPPRTRLYSLPIQANTTVQLIAGERYNRIALITPPDVAFTVFVGDSGLSASTGMALVGGQSTEIVLAGFQEIYAITNAPVPLRVNIQIAPILLAERERRL